MKSLLLFALVASTSHLLAESAIPKAYDPERYAETVVDSPFALETPKVEDEKKEEPVNVLTDLYISGLTQHDGEDYVLVKGVGDMQSITLIGNKPYKAQEIPGMENPMAKYNGVFVKAVHWSDQWSGVRVDLGHGNDPIRTNVGFKSREATVAGAPRMPQMFGQPNVPGAPGAPGGRFGQRGSAPGVQQPSSLIPAGLQKQPQVGGAIPGRTNTLTPGMPRAGGTQNIQGGGVPRPGGGQGFRGGGGGNGATNSPNAGPSRTRDRGNPIRNR